MAMSRLVSASDPQCLYFDDTPSNSPGGDSPRRFEVEDLPRISGHRGWRRLAAEQSEYLQNLAFIYQRVGASRLPEAAPDIRGWR